MTVTGQDGYDILQVEKDVKLTLKNLNLFHLEVIKPLEIFILGE